MAGGLGTRLQMGEKPMAKLLGRPLIDYVVRALEKSSIERIFVATTPNVPKTKRWAEERGLVTVETPCHGYVPDMIIAVEVAEIKRPVLIVMADLPLLKDRIVDEILEVYEKVAEPALSVHTSLEIHRRIGSRPDALFNYQGEFIVPAGINVLNGARIKEEQEDYHLIMDKIELAVNVNTSQDLEICRSILKKDMKI